ncbi:hypothetical protein HanRHA438_Chr17g0833731 [Helianthus annuus]|nr:hypothetical protein HanHA89_Chr17g0723901 [Helianthus annuus]KAJ0828135.1 hypothetical protein HanRHA438_Chr17g0833731 [Helianthus annuus]KAJ0842444.1 hypothetical protein HanPSC8_Chr14g0641781 [Helianthus annuus]
MIGRSSQSKIMMGPAGLGHKVPTKLVQVKGNILESGRLVWVRTDSGLSGFGPNWIQVKSKYFKKWSFWFGENEFRASDRVRSIIKHHMFSI